ncbi:thioredoxin-like protein [Gymnopus androsaceus JB14]|uniref:Thioredoxin-like protein n=1 Tax=Gymnopus androsaceus JB14 TaxID=1447944 RepID=A0A6A4H8S7_9AGAR|nr:thioredoxin-like protein [Gymnopus androsaceus JB14]
MAYSLTLRALKSSTAAPRLIRTFSASASRSDHYPDADFSTFKKVTTGPQSEGRVVLVDFYADWCRPCHMLSPILKSISNDPDVKSGTGFPVDVMTINTESEDGMELSQRYKVRALPTVIAFREGQNVMQFVGALPESEVRNFLGRV